MTAPYNPPVKNEDFVIHIALNDRANPSSFKSTPTIASGDFKISKDGAAFTNIDITATANTHIVPATAGGVLLKLFISQTDMNCDNVVILAQDVAGAEWADYLLSIPTTA